MDKEKVTKTGIATLILGVILFLFWGIFFSDYHEENTENFTEYINEESSNTEPSTEASTIIVQIAGEVNKPDVYIVPEDTRLFQLVDKAGGFTDKADKDSLNLAKALTDGEKIVVNKIDDKVDKIDGLKENSNKGSEINERININTATAQELTQLEGIGEDLAENIIEFRNKWGDFTSISEIREVDGIGEGIYDKIKDSITID